MNKFIIYQGYINCVMDNSYFYWNTELHLVLAVCFNPRLLESLLIYWKVCSSIGRNRDSIGRFRKSNGQNRCSYGQNDVFIGN